MKNSDNMEKRFDLTIFNQNRVLLGIVLFGVSLPLALLLGLKFETNLFKILIGISIFGLINLLSYYFVIGHLTVTIADNTLKFSWEKKFFLNYKHIDSINLTDISTLVIDSIQGNGKVLRKIMVPDKVIPIHNGLMFFKKDSQELINFLSINTRAEIIDSWEVWKRRGWLKIAYHINNILIIGGLGIVFLYVLKRGFSSHLLLYMILPISQLVLYKLQMKGKID